MAIDLLSERITGLAMAVPETDLRRRIDHSVSRALFDREYANRLLTDPTIALEDGGCPPQQFRSLRNIHASDLVDFARQAQALFWPVEPQRSYLEQQFSLAAVAR